MSNELGEAAELLLQDHPSAEAFAEQLAGSDLDDVVRRALDPADPRLNVVAWPGQRLRQPLQRGDFLLRGRSGRRRRLSVVDDPQLLSRPEARRAALIAANGPGRFVRVLEVGEPFGESGFARRVCGPDGLVLPDLTIVRHAGTDAGETVAAPQPILRQGSTGPAVAAAQARLNDIHRERLAAGERGLDRCPLVVDGQFGSNTRAAVVSLQRIAFSSSPADWDGVVGPRTWAALGGEEEGGGPVKLPTRCPGLAPVERIDNFDFGSDRVLPRHQPKIVAIARCVIESERTASPIRKQTVVGHTDSVGNEPENQALGLRRAEAVKSEILAAIRRITGRAPKLQIATETRGEGEPVSADAGANRRVEVVTPVKVAPPPPQSSATIAFVLDEDGDHQVDAKAPVATALMYGLWDQAYDASGDVRNEEAEARNFVGSDRRRFYIRVRDPGASGSTVTARWRTLNSAGANDDAPASQDITLTETAAGSKLFVSRALMLVSDEADARQPTHSGLSTGADANVRARGQSNHRLRRATLDGQVRAEYRRAGGGTLVQTTLPVFQRSPERRQRVSVNVVHLGIAGTKDELNLIDAQFAQAAARWAQTGLLVERGTTQSLAIPPASRDAKGHYRGDGANPAAEDPTLRELIKITPKSSLTICFTRIALNASGDPETNAYATIAERTNVALEDRFFVFLHIDLDPNISTMGHEMYHCLFNRFDFGGVPQQFFTFRSSPPPGPYPDVRKRRRIQLQHAPHAGDPDTDPNDDCMFNWARRRRTARHPAAGGGGAATATTGNILTRRF